MNKRDKKVIVVLGMHRSGTSVIARGLQVLGVELGDRLMPPSEGNNPKGFWEDLDINALNIEMLHSLKSEWHFLTPVQPSDVDTLCRNGYLDRAVELLRGKTAGVELFGFKDPRVAKLLPFWKKVFAHAQLSIDYVLVIRHPLSVCSSLSKRNGFDVEKSYLLWLEHVIGSLVGTQGENLVLVDYDSFMQTPEVELDRIANELQLPIDVAELQRFQLEFLDPGMQHTVYGLDELMRDTTSPPLLREVYSSLLEALTGNIEESTLQDRMAQWDREFSRMRSTLAFIDLLDSRLSTIPAERNALRSERRVLLRENAQMQRALTAKEQALKRLRAELQAIYRSRSWRLTKPLREIFGWFRRPG